MEEIQIEVYGRVQGVNFRNSVKSFANKHGLKGYILNRKDGSVLALAQGNKKDLEKLIEWLRTSPGFSKVESVDFKWKKIKARYEGFEVVRDGNYFVDKVKSFLSLGKSLIVENKERVPGHVAIIPDGNRRWAREKGLNASFGHYTAGSTDHVVSLFEEAQKLGVKYLSIWGFSTENWNRDKREINAIFDLIIKNVGRFKQLADKHKIRFRHLGRKDRLPRKLVKALRKLEEETHDYSDFNVQLCLDYGGRDEIIRAVNKMLKSGVKKVDEKMFSDNLDSAGIPDPDLIIRTSGEKRLSGLLPFQSVYAELYFSDSYFPDFDALELRKAVKSFGNRVRRFGGTARQDLAKKN